MEDFGQTGKPRSGIWVHGKRLEWKSSNLDFSLALLHGPRAMVAPLWDLKDELYELCGLCLLAPSLGQTQSLGCLKRAGPQQRSGQRRVSSLSLTPPCGLWLMQGRRKATGVGAS